MPLLTRCGVWSIYAWALQVKRSKTQTHDIMKSVQIHLSKWHSCTDLVDEAFTSRPGFSSRIVPYEDPINRSVTICLKNNHVFNDVLRITRSQHRKHLSVASSFQPWAPGICREMQSNIQYCMLCWEAVAFQDWTGLDYDSSKDTIRIYRRCCLFRDWFKFISKLESAE